MKKIFSILLWVAIGLAVLIILYYLYNKGVFGIENGKFEFSWQKLAMILALGFGPLKLLFSNTDKKLASITEKHSEFRQNEAEYQKQLDVDIKSREQQINLLNKDIELMDTKLQLLQEKRNNVSSEVENMTIDEKKQAFNKYFGN